MRSKLAALAVAFAFLAGCSSTPSQEAEDKYREGVTKSTSDTQAAIQIFEEGLGQYPSFHKMRFRLACLQYETGEKQHLDERRLSQLARKLEEEGKRAEAEKASREAEDRHNKALPFYRAARENFLIVAKKDNDDVRRAWAHVNIHKCDVFFEDWESAADHLEKAIELGKPTGAQLAQWKEHLAAVKREAQRRKKGSGSM